MEFLALGVVVLIFGFVGYKVYQSKQAAAPGEGGSGGGSSKKRGDEQPKNSK